MQKQQPRAPRVRVVDMQIDGIGQHFVEKANAPVDRHLGLYFAAMMVTHLLGVFLVSGYFKPLCGTWNRLP